MAAMTAVQPTAAGVVTTSGTAVSASDTIASTLLGSKGIYLEILNGSASVDTMTISDSGVTPAGNIAGTGGTYTVVVTNATNKIFYISPAQVNLSTGNVTITHSQVTTVSYKLYPIG
jgi:hypothetical protein